MSANNMKTLALMASYLAGSATAAISMTVRYTDNMIDVGDLDAFAVTWDKIFATSGSLQGVVTDNSYQTDLAACQTDDAKDLTVRVTMDGAWGAQDTVTQSDMRAAMVSTMWSSLEALWQENQFTVYQGCYGLTWQETPLYNASAACGPRSTASCDTACPDATNPATVQCETGALAGKLPSTLKVTTFQDGTLLPNELTVTFAATANEVTNGGCGLVGTISAKLASFIPVVGGMFAEGIAFECGDA